MTTISLTKPLVWSITAGLCLVFTCQNAKVNMIIFGALLGVCLLIIYFDYNRRQNHNESYSNIMLRAEYPKYFNGVIIMGLNLVLVNLGFIANPLLSRILVYSNFVLMFYTYRLYRMHPETKNMDMRIDSSASFLSVILIITSLALVYYNTINDPFITQMLIYSNPIIMIIGHYLDTFSKNSKVNKGIDK